MNLLASLFLCLGSIQSREPTIYVYDGKVYYDQNFWYGPGWYYGRWYGSPEPYWIWRRRHPYWWNRLDHLEKWDKQNKRKL